MVESDISHPPPRRSLRASTENQRDQTTKTDGLSDQGGQAETMNSSAAEPTKEPKKKKEKKKEEEETGEMRHGERLLDDLMNTFCDKIQKTAPFTIEGMMAIQFIMMATKQRKWTQIWRQFWCVKKVLRVAAGEVAGMISGKKDAIQILFDSERTHYVVLYFDSEKRRLTMYDSLVDRNNFEKELNNSLFEQIQVIFGHLFTRREVRLFIRTDYEKQNDDWSCGYRAIGCIVEIVRRRDPSRVSYSTEAVLAFLNDVLEDKNLHWSKFEDVRLGQTRKDVVPSYEEINIYSNLEYSIETKSEPSSRKSCSHTSVTGSASHPNVTAEVSHLSEISGNNTRTSRTDERGSTLSVTGSTRSESISSYHSHDVTGRSTSRTRTDRSGRSNSCSSAYSR